MNFTVSYTIWVLLSSFFVIGVLFLIFWTPEKGKSQIITYPDLIKESATTPPASITVMSYNIAFGAGLDNLKGRAQSKDVIMANLDKIKAQVLTHNPDILAVQEIDRYSYRSYFIDQVEYLAKACGYPYVAVVTTWDKLWVPFPVTWDIRRHFGRVIASQAVFSKYPITDYQYDIYAKPASNSVFYNFFYLDRAAQFCTIQLAPQLKIGLSNVHLEAYDGYARQSQVTQLIDTSRYLYSDIPFILVGDFNALHPDMMTQTRFPDEPDNDYGNDTSISKLLKSSFLTDAFAAKRKQDGSSVFTFPSDSPNRQLDYGFYSGESLKLESADVMTTDGEGSDHLPVVFSLGLD